MLISVVARFLKESKKTSPTLVVGVVVYDKFYNEFYGGRTSRDKFSTLLIIFVW